MKRHLTPLHRPPWHASDGVEGQGLDGGVSMGGAPTEQADDVLDRLVRASPQVVVELGIGLFPRKMLGKGAPEGFAEVSRLDAGDVLHQPEDVGRCRRHRSSCVEAREPVQLTEKPVSSLIQVVQQIGLGIGDGHPVHDCRRAQREDLGHPAHFERRSAIRSIDVKSQRAEQRPTFPPTCNGKFIISTRVVVQPEICG